MKLVRLRLLGFKTFVDPAEVLIEPGLTGLVGPNGCGKSNLVEAMRWAMGETSFKAMRGSGMDDVIFSGSAGRPPRNSAEVTLVVDNSDRLAPSAFDGSEVLEVTRRIERETGSVYRINGREVRARDVQILFADASTGSRSPALVRQGQIGDLISARPEARRLILEEAAGISGLHSRRHEAEIRLDAAEHNLARVDDLMGQLHSQLDGLKRQARQAHRYRSLSAAIRRTKATLLLLEFQEGRKQRQIADEEAAANRARVAELTRAAADTATTRAVAAHRLPSLREQVRTAGEAVQRLAATRTALEIEARRVSERLADLEQNFQRIEHDLARVADSSREAKAAIDRIEREMIEVRGRAERLEASIAEAEELKGAAESAAAQADAAHREGIAAAAGLEARRVQIERALQDAKTRREREANGLTGLAKQRAAIDSALAAVPDPAAARNELARAEAALRAAETAASDAEDDLETARKRESSTRSALAEAERDFGRLDAEAKALRKVVSSAAEGSFEPVLSSVSVRRGYETAVGAALGEDLNASEHPDAAARWKLVEPDAPDAPLPPGTLPLLDFVRAPAVLARRLRQIGLVDRSLGALMQARLEPGQRLVSREGDIWRWDGLALTADAPSPAARRLAERGRLAEVEQAIEVATARLAVADKEWQAAGDELRHNLSRQEACRSAVREARRRAGEAGSALVSAERKRAELEARLAGLGQAENRAKQACEEAQTEVRKRTEELNALATPASHEAVSDGRRRSQEAQRALEAARSAIERLHREQALNRARTEALDREREAWRTRAADAAAHTHVLAARSREVAADRAKLDGAPGRLREAQLSMLADAATAERERARAGDALAEAELQMAEADRAASAAERSLAGAREALARAEARSEACGDRLKAAVDRIAEAFGCTPDELPRTVELNPPSAVLDAAGLQRELDRLDRDRERLGAVNLRAEDEARDVQQQYDLLDQQRRDLVEAIARLRQAIQTLNREGRERLLAAFQTVNAKFGELFATLFDGGTAELQLTESEDPLDAGLDVLARPPGKKPQTLTLLSGGEQALTALALIFAVFLTNPAPVCVLDEVDAPLDDHNVERFCDLLDDVRRRSDTRFFLITHNPITMARMDRLYGVTMLEQGVSRVVSVDLETAERFRDAG